MTTASVLPETVDPAQTQVVESALLGGRVRLLQPARGYRAGMDAALLAAAVAARPGQRIFEAGCGAGAVLMQVAARCPGLILTGLERDPAAAALARRNADLNGVQGQTTVITGDVATGYGNLDLPLCDWAVSNPPFFDDETALRAPSPGKRGAWIADDGLVAWTDILLSSVKDGGRILMIHRADRLADILGLLNEKAGSFAILPVQPFADQPAKRVLIKAVKRGKAPLVLRPALVLHDRSGAKHTVEAEAILRGEADLIV
ncbi:tRNA1(Val) (adenine(37)-N6)-methyltransferase [Brevundimonas sp.]|uniref:tRNA1(Val) (adenine(37)-N6)-methyltransferase n=1 Tax=Brevundimonas sp. TaxID=1871086 RepID=UPI003BAA42B8